MGCPLTGYHIYSCMEASRCLPHKAHDAQTVCWQVPTAASSGWRRQGLRKTLVRKRARCHSQHRALSCLLCAVYHWVQKGLQLICCVLLETFLRILLCMRWASVLLSLPPKRLARALVGLGGLKPRQQPGHLPKHKLHHGGLPNRVLELSPRLRSRPGLVPRPKRRLPRSSPGAAVDPLDLTKVTR